MSVERFRVALGSDDIDGNTNEDISCEIGDKVRCEGDCNEKLLALMCKLSSFPFRESNSIKYTLKEIAPSLGCAAHRFAKCTVVDGSRLRREVNAYFRRLGRWAT
jgi:hypothetical protein